MNIDLYTTPDLYTTVLKHEQHAEEWHRESWCSTHDKARWYATYKLSIKNACNFVLRYAQEIRLPPVEIATCSDGSVDLHWQIDNLTLLINITANLKTPGDFYGDVRNDKEEIEVVKGNLRAGVDYTWLFQWLIQ